MNEEVALLSTLARPGGSTFGNQIPNSLPNSSVLLSNLAWDLSPFPLDSGTQTQRKWKLLNANQSSVVM